MSIKQRIYKINRAQAAVIGFGIAVQMFGERSPSAGYRAAFILNTKAYVAG
jgi:hypothetical protein